MQCVGTPCALVTHQGLDDPRYILLRVGNDHVKEEDLNKCIWQLCVCVAGYLKHSAGGMGEAGQLRCGAGGRCQQRAGLSCSVRGAQPSPADRFVWSTELALPKKKI